MGSGGKIPQKGRFSPNLDGVEEDESQEEGLEDEKAQEDNHDLLRAGFLGLSCH